MASEVGGEQRCGRGARLRGAREKKGLTVLEAAEKLHVDARTLEALEAEDFAALGADVYVRGHRRRARLSRAARAVTPAMAGRAWCCRRCWGCWDLRCWCCCGGCSPRRA